MRIRRGFTIIELLVVVSIIALLIGILLPAIGKARDQAKQTQSLTNLRNLGTAHQSYAAEWSDRQFTLVNDSIASYGSNRASSFNAFYQANGGQNEGQQHPGANLGWGYVDGNGAYVLFYYRSHPGGSANTANQGLTLPICFYNPVRAFGSFRLPNVRQFNQYVSGRFYDKVFYAPKDTIVWNDIATAGGNGYNCFDDPGEYCDRPAGAQGDIPAWSSYVLSPAGMYNPEVLSRDYDLNDEPFVNPWTRSSSFRSPSFGQARYPALKTHMLEHHWLQNRRAECNPAFSPGTYGGCEPFYFNHAWESSPMTLFYDGHVGSVGTRKAERADGRSIAQAGHGLWTRGTPFGDDGYFIAQGYDLANTSYHILTTDGILGRDIITE